MANSSSETPIPTQQWGWLVITLSCISTVLATLAWQLLLLFVATLILENHALDMHTRYRREMGIAVWIAGAGLNIGALYWAARYARAHAAIGVRIGIGLLFLMGLALIWISIAMQDFHEAMQD